MPPDIDMRRGGRVVERARLESVYTLIAYRGFESPSLRHSFKALTRFYGKAKNLFPRCLCTSSFDFLLENGVSCFNWTATHTTRQIGTHVITQSERLSVERTKMVIWK